jgi:hypothetical protein
LIATLAKWIGDKFVVVSGQLGNIFRVFHAGLCAGAFVWGVLVDIFGKPFASHFAEGNNV